MSLPSSPGPSSPGSSSQVVDVELDRTTELRISYDDGVVAVFPIADVRHGCPCAGCRGRRDAGQPVTTATEVHAVDAELHGNWGIAIRWSDGHDTGIYAWAHMRQWWDAGLPTTET